VRPVESNWKGKTLRPWLWAGEAVRRAVLPELKSLHLNKEAKLPVLPLVLVGEESERMATPGSSIAPVAATANEFIEQQLDLRLEQIEKEFGAHALAFSGPIIGGVDNILRGAIEKRCKQGTPSHKLIVVLTTEGGYIEVVQRMVDTLRHHYAVVEFVVPNYAYSAGTVFVMSGDAIHMDYYSRLGPIDPQIETARGNSVSALGQNSA